MLRYSRLALLVTCLLALVFGLSFSVQPVQASLGTLSSAPDPARVSAAPKSTPVMFIENVGQFAEGSRFQVRGGNGAIWLAEDGLRVTVLEKPKADASTRQLPPSPRRPDEQKKDTPRKGVNLKLSFAGANLHPTLEPFDRLETHVSYFIGSDRSKWHADVPVWGGVRYKDLYRGIDLEITGENGQMVQRMVAHAGADLSAVRLRVDGADNAALEGEQLMLTTAVGEYRMPLLQLTGVGSTELRTPTLAGNQVDSPFARLGVGNQSSVLSDASDLLYSTFLGGTSDDYGRGVAVDASGAVYVTGYTSSSDFPTTPGAFDTTLSGSTDAFAVKLNPAGSPLAYATFLGGSSDDLGYGIAVDSSGAAYVTGETSSSDFPTTPGAFDTTCGTDGKCNRAGVYYVADAFVVKLDAAGSALTYATFLGGFGGDYGTGIAIDSSGAAYITGATDSSDFPTTPGAFDTTCGTDGNCNYGGYYHSHDAFVVKLNATGSALTYATFLGASDDDRGYGIAIDSSGAAYVTGETGSSDFPTTPGAFDRSFNGGDSDAFAVKLPIQIFAVENDDSGIQYDGWRGVGDSRASGGTYRVSNTSGDTVTFTFTGTSVQWVTTKESDMGIAQVSLDGAAKKDQDLYSPTPLFNSVLTVGGLKNAKHTLVIWVSGNKNASATDTNVAVDAFVVGSTTAVAGTRTTQDNANAVQYDKWRGAANSGASGGSYRVSSDAGSVVTFKFTGDSVGWITAKGPAYGQAEVTIDGVSKGTYDLYRAKLQWRVAIPFTSLGGGAHTLEIHVLGTKNSASKGLGVVVDAFRGVITPD